MFLHRVGETDLALAVHGRGVGSPQWMFPDVPAATLTPAIAPHLDGDGNIDFVFSSVVVELGDQVVLLDAGPAPEREADIPSILLALRDAGLSPSDVGIVVISHCHGDHVGGLTDGCSRITFPNARHFVGEDEFVHWTSGPQREEVGGRSLAVLEAARALTLVNDEHDAVPGLTLIPAPGHTPGHLAAGIDSGHDRALYVGDALAHRVNVAYPEWNHFSDMLQGPARRTRQELVERAAAGDMLVLASHIPVAGRVREVGGARTFVPVDTIAGADASH